MNRLCKILNIEIPIVQAPVGSIAGSELASAVSIAGGLGGMGVTWTNSDDLRTKIASIRSKTDYPFYVNYALAFPPVTLDVALELGCPIVTFSWGIPEKLIKRCHLYYAKVGIQVGNSTGALIAKDAGADFIIVQGMEAGGHVQSTTPIEILLHQIFQLELGLPIVVAGGISTGKEIANWISRGADGVMLGTRFVAANESLAHEEYKQLLLTSVDSDTALTHCFDGGWPHAMHRVLRNATLNTWEAKGCAPPGCRPGEGDVIAISATNEPIFRYEDTAPRTGMSGEIEAMCCYAGSGVGKIEAILSASDILHDLWDDACKLRNPSDLV